MTTVGSGESDVIVIAGLPPSVTYTAFETPPPGAGFDTVAGKVPAKARSAAVSCAEMRVALPGVVTRGEPFQRTIDS